MISFDRHIDIEVSYKILQLEIPKLVLILHYLSCFQKGLFGGNFEQKHPWSFRGSVMSLPWEEKCAPITCVKNVLVPFCVFTLELFTLWLLIDWTKNSNNVIYGEQKFINLAFTLEANGQWTTPSDIQHSLWVLAPNVHLPDLWKPKLSSSRQTYFFQTYTNSTICVF
jgi:hypothetical protein